MKIYLDNQQKKLPLNLSFIKKIVRKILIKKGQSAKSEVNIIFTNNLKITRLNKRYLGRSYPTDILAFGMREGFPLKGNAYLLGDIIVSAQAAVAKARELKTNPQTEVILYVIHGLLHLLGYDDKTLKDKKIIRQKEKEYLKLCLRRNEE